MATGIGIERYAGERYSHAHLSKVKLRPDAHRALVSWMKAPRHFLVFMGAPGCGKTFTSLAIMRHLYRVAQKVGRQDELFFYPQRIIFDRMREIISKNWSTERFLQDISSSLVLGIDDFGATRNNEWQVETLNQIIADRYDTQRPTIITTNLDFHEIEDVFHARTRGRLEASENLIITEWEENLRAQGL